MHVKWTDESKTWCGISTETWTAQDITDSEEIEISCTDCLDANPKYKDWAVKVVRTKAKELNKKKLVPAA